jgi:flagellar motor protein MotB
MNEDLSERQGEPEENYFVSLSDLMTGVVFIFVILLCAFAFHYQKESQALQRLGEEASKMDVQARAAAAVASEEKTKAERFKQAAELAEADARQKDATVDALSKLLRERDAALRKALQKVGEEANKMDVQARAAAADAREEKTKAERFKQAAELAEADARRKDATVDALSKLLREQDAALRKALQRVGEEASKMDVQARAAAAVASEEKTKAERFKQAAEPAEANARQKDATVDALSKLLRERDAALRSVLNGLVNKLSERGVRVLFQPATGVIRLPEELLFSTGSDVLSDSGRMGLSVLADELVPILRSGCAEGSIFRLEALFIEGHTDSDPIRSTRFTDNWDLSAARATNTYRALIAAKPELESFMNPSNLRVLGVSGYGENRPVAPNDTDKNKKSNRRVDLRFLMAHPTDSELNRVGQEIEAFNRDSAPPQR